MAETQKPNEPAVAAPTSDVKDPEAAKPTPNLDTTIPGGKYLMGNRLVNALGEFIDKDGNKVDVNGKSVANE